MTFSYLPLNLMTLGIRLGPVSIAIPHANSSYTSGLQIRTKEKKKGVDGIVDEFLDLDNNKSKITHGLFN